MCAGPPPRTGLPLSLSGCLAAGSCLAGPPLAPGDPLPWARRGEGGGPGPAAPFPKSPRLCWGSASSPPCLAGPHTSRALLGLRPPLPGRWGCAWGRRVGRTLQVPSGTPPCWDVPVKGELRPPKTHAHVLSPGPGNGTLFGYRIFARTVSSGEVVQEAGGWEAASDGCVLATRTGR